jgi:hypothetical protein
MTTEELAQQFYAETMLEHADTLASYAPEQIEQARVDTLARCRAYVAKVGAAVENKDAPALVNSVHRHNKHSRKIFHQLTGIDPGKTDKSCVAAIKQHVGEAEYDRQFAERRQAREKDKAEREANAEANRREHALKKTVRWAPIGGGLVETKTVREVIDTLLAAGYTPVDGKRGAFAVINLQNGSKYYQFRTKYEMAYIREQAAEVAA